jgi:hypothetical protein
MRTKNKIPPRWVHRVFITFVLTCCTLSNIYGQKYMEIIENSNTRNFDKIVKAVEDYYKDKDKGKGSYYKQFKRWEEYNKYRLDEKGDIQNTAQRNFKEAYEYNLRLARKGGLRTEAFMGSWTNMGMVSSASGVGRVNCIAVDPSNPSIIYAGTPAGGLWRSTVGGNTWTSITDGISSLGVSSIAIDPTSPIGNRSIYILTGDGDAGDTKSVGVLKSSNNGATWQSTGLNWPVANEYRGYKLIMHPSNNQIMMVASNAGIFRTTDGGVTWTQVLSGIIAYDLEFKPFDPQTVYAGCRGSFYKSTNGGANWTLVATGVPSATRTAIAVSANNSNYVYFLVAPDVGSLTGLYRSDNSGTTFSLRSNSPNILGWEANGSDAGSQGFYDLAIAASPTNAEEIHVGGINCWKSVNGGTNWTNTSYWIQSQAGAGNYTHADIHALEFFGTTLYFGSDGGIGSSSNNAGDWTTLWNGLNVLQPYRLSVDATNTEKFICGTQDNGSKMYQAGIFTDVFGGDGMDCAIDQTNTNTSYVSIYYGAFYKSTNNGASYTSITPSNLNGPWVTPFLISPNTNTTLYAALYGNMWKSTNQGTNWSNISNAQIAGGSYYIDQFDVSKSNENVLFASVGKDLYKTSNGGTNWAILSGLPATQAISRILIDPANANNVWVCYGGYTSGSKVYKTTNGGTSWTNISGTLPNIPVNCLAFLGTGSPTKLFAGTDNGVYVLESTATDWVSFSNSLPNVIIQDLEIRNNLLYAATYGRGIWRSEVGTCTSNLVYSGTQNGAGKFEAGNSITSTAIAGISSNIKYKAGANVRLNSGFNTLTGAVFTASIGTCGSAFRTESVALSGIYTGPMEGVSLSESEENDQELLDQKMIVFPNPASGIANIEYYVQTDGSQISISILDAMGHKVKDLIVGSSHDKGKYVSTLDVSGLPKGLYVCTMLENNKLSSVKIEVK